MAKTTHSWFDRVLSMGRFAGSIRGMVTLIEQPDGAWSVWVFDHCVGIGSRRDMRNLYADHMRGDWLETFYRS